MKNGDLLTAQPHLLPFVRHYGIAIVDDAGNTTIVHLTPLASKLAFDTLEQFQQGRDIVDIQPTMLKDIPAGKVMDKALLVRDRGYNLFNWNCEHFINYMIGDEIVSPQVEQWLPGIAVAFAILFLIWNNKD